MPTLRRTAAALALLVLLGACGGAEADSGDSTGGPDTGEAIGSENVIEGQPAPNVGNGDVDQPDTGTSESGY